MIALNALATRAGGAAARVREVARRAPLCWRTGILLLRNIDAGIQLESAPDRVVTGWPYLLGRCPPVPRRAMEAPVLRRLFRDWPIDAVLHYGAYVPVRPPQNMLNVLCFTNLAPWNERPHSRSARNRMLRWLFERTEKRADLIIVQSEATRTFLRQRYPKTAGRIVVLKNGVALPELRRPRERYGFLLLGDIYAYRRIDCVVRAHAGLADHIREAHPLIIVGNPDRDRRALKDVMRAVQDTGRGNVQIPGLLPRPQALELMAASAAFVSFAAIDNGPNALVEAAAIGTPSVLSDIPVHRELAGPRAYFARDITELTQAMHAAATAPPLDLAETVGPLDTWDTHVAELGSILAATRALSGQPAIAVAGR
jgi:glycosyltransferase involved in cell wall biosynthesis